jgi:hypothetical protein
MLLGSPIARAVVLDLAVDERAAPIVGDPATIARVPMIHGYMVAARAAPARFADLDSLVSKLDVAVADASVDRLGIFLHG